MLCKYNFSIPQAFVDGMPTNGIKILSAQYIENGQTVNYDLSALDSCVDGVCLAQSMQTAFPSVAGDWYFDGFAGVLGGGAVLEQLESITIGNVIGDTATANAIQFDCVSQTGSTATTDAPFTQDEISTIGYIEVIISFFILLGAIVLGISKQ